MKAKPLRKGDIVDVVAPASRCSNEELAKGVAFIRSLGLVPRVPADLFGKKRPLFSNVDAVRLKHLRKALYATDSKMVWCVRGGYGSLRLIPEMQNWKKPKQAKIFLGYSDITTLHAYLNQAWSWSTIHGTMVERAGSGMMAPKERKTLLDLLFGELSGVDYKNLKPLNAAARKSGSIEGTLWGGNMAVLQSALGTPSALKPNGHILFFEDIGEAPHRVDRMLSQFEQAGWFKKAKAIVFGHFRLDDNKMKRDLWNDVIPRFAGGQKIPVLKGLKVGHDKKIQMPLPFNTKAVLKTGASGRLIVPSGIAP